MITTKITIKAYKKKKKLNNGHGKYEGCSKYYLTRKRNAEHDGGQWFMPY